MPYRDALYVIPIERKGIRLPAMLQWCPREVEFDLKDSRFRSFIVELPKKIPNHVPLFLFINHVLRLLAITLREVSTNRISIVFSQVSPPKLHLEGFVTLLVAIFLTKCLVFINVERI